MALTHTALTEALNGSTPSKVDSRSANRASTLGLTLSSPLHGLTPCSSRNSSMSDVRSFHTAKLAVEESAASPDRRRRPSPITIPVATQDAPLFSSYPLSGDGRVSRHGKHTKTPEASQSTSISNIVSSSSQPRPGATMRASWEVGGSTRSGAAAFSPIRSPQPGTSVSRRRSLSTLGLVKRAIGQSDPSQSTSSSHRNTTNHKRRASLGSGDFEPSRWRDMATVAQLDNLPYGFGPGDYQPSKTIPVSELDLPPIPISTDHPADLLGLADLTISRKDVPQRSSSLGRHLLLTGDVPMRTTSLLCDPNAMDNVSVVSLSEHCLSSPSLMTNSLPSTKTSLSRSVRNGKEGDEMKRAELAQVAQALLDKRRMILLEIVETEVTYVHQLRSLVHVYLPQLAVLPFVSDRIHQHIARNTVDLLEFHVQFAVHMVDILKYAGLGYHNCEAETLDSVTKEIANLFVREVPSFSLYSDYCAGSMEATGIVSDITHRVDYEAFEKRCQYITSTTVQASLQDILYNKPGEASRTRLRFKDILIAPIQRVCRYPLLLASLLADVNREAPTNDVVQSVEAAQAVMRAVAENADDARLRKEAELKTARIADRIDSHQALTKEFVHRLGTCRLIGALDVLYHHPIHAPLDRPTKVRYFAALLYRGYLILAKVRRNKTLEPRHFLPLEVVELIDITEGSLPCSLRLTLRDHNFDLAASCDAEKELWTAELKAARDESIMPPFELPSSVPLFAPRSRHSSTASRDLANRTPSKRYSTLGTESLNITKRHTFVAPADFQVPGLPSNSTPHPLDPTPLEDSSELSHTPEYRQSQPSTVLIRRPSLTTRLMVDRALCDVVSEGLATARSKAQLQYPSGPDPRRMSRFDTPMLRRRRSLAGLSEVRSVDVVSEVRGAVIPGARPRSLMRTRSFILTPTTAEMENSDISRNTSFSSIGDANKRRSPMTTLRGLEMTMGPGGGKSNGHKRTQSASTLSQPLVQSPIEMMEDDIEEEKPRKSLNRARSMPSSPVTPTVAAFPDVRSQSTRGIGRVPEDTYVLVGNNVRAAPRSKSQTTPPPSTSSVTISPARAVKRSLSFFGRKSLSALTDSSDEHGSMSVSGAPSPSTTPPTPDASPNTPKRRRSLRLLGQFRGFTPI